MVERNDNNASVPSLASVGVIGHTGFVGGELTRRIRDAGCEPVTGSLSTGLDARDLGSVQRFLDGSDVSTLFNCAATVGGLAFGAEYAGTMFLDNAKTILSLLEACIDRDIQLISPISNCAYPGAATVYREREFWDGALHDSVLAYGGVRKFGYIGAWAVGQQFGLRTKNLVFPNMYGPEDHLDPVRAHALGALVGRFLRAAQAGDAEVVVWGSGRPVREWMHVSDAAAALVAAIDADFGGEIVNVGTGQGVSIAELARLIADAVGYSGRIVFDASRPDGAPVKTMDGSRGAEILSWKPQVTIEQGIAETVVRFRQRITDTAHEGKLGSNLD